MPNMANDTATKAKWYHMVTDQIRVKSNSSKSVADVIRKMPKYVFQFAENVAFAKGISI